MAICHWSLWFESVSGTRRCTLFPLNARLGVLIERATDAALEVNSVSMSLAAYRVTGHVSKVVCDLLSA
jgi:hypothetical protein